jgi:carboxyl-terminal processing protease
MRTQGDSWLSSFLIVLLSAVALLLLGAVFLSQQRETPAPPAKQSFGLEDKDILLYMEAIAKIRDNASFLTAATTREQLIDETLRSYLAQRDPSSDYLTRGEFRKFKESQDDRYVGIGMEIRKERDGRILCLPYPGSPAAQAGIVIGDELKTIDAIPVRGKSIFAVASIARGKPGTLVELVISSKNGVEKQAKVRRAAMTAESVSTTQWSKVRVVKIVSFTRDTKDKLRRILKTWESGKPIVMDLRGNAGGDLHAAIDCAMLFLAKGKRIVSIETRHRTKSYENNTVAENENSPIYLWQDEATASAAEVFIAALMDNGRAVSIGKRTFGKGTMQDIIELSNGSAIVLTTGRLETPRGVSYDGDGLAPTHAISGGTTAYAAKVEELTGVASNPRRSE